MTSRKLSLLVLAGALLFGAVRAASAGEVNAAVAANFTAPVQQIVELFQKETGHTVKLSFGSSGKFYSQIQERCAVRCVAWPPMKRIPNCWSRKAWLSKTRVSSMPLGKLVLWSAQARLGG